MNRQARIRLSPLQRGCLGGVVLATMVIPGCTAGRDFRDAALPSLRTGVDAIVDGLLDGIFAVIEPEPQGN